MITEKDETRPTLARPAAGQVWPCGHWLFRPETDALLSRCSGCCYGEDVGFNKTCFHLYGDVVSKSFQKMNCWNCWKVEMNWNLQAPKVVSWNSGDQICWPKRKPINMDKWWSKMFFECWAYSFQVDVPFFPIRLLVLLPALVVPQDTHQTTENSNSSTSRLQFRFKLALQQARSFSPWAAQCSNLHNFHPHFDISWH